MITLAEVYTVYIIKIILYGFNFSYSIEIENILKHDSIIFFLKVCILFYGELQLYFAALK